MAKTTLRQRMLTLKRLERWFHRHVNKTLGQAWPRSARPNQSVERAKPLESAVSGSPWRSIRLPSSRFSSRPTHWPVQQDGHGCTC